MTACALVAGRRENDVQQIAESMGRAGQILVPVAQKLGVKLGG